MQNFIILSRITFLVAVINSANLHAEKNPAIEQTDDGFLIAEEDMRLRGYGDIIGFKQSGIKYFKIADPIHHKDLFKVAENYFQKNFNISITPTKYDFLMKLFDKAEVININFED